MRSVRVIALLCAMLVPDVASAQLVEPGEYDQFVGVFLYRPKDSGWIGAVASKGSRGLRPQLELEWQGDYGSQSDVSKNSGAVGLTYNFGATSWDTPFDWRVALSGGLEHQRAAPDLDGGLEHRFNPFGAGKLILFGARPLQTAVRQVAGASADVTTVELAWVVDASLQTADAIQPDNRTAQRLFLSPSAVAWLSVIPAFTAARADIEPTQFYRVVLKSELALLAARGDGMSQAHWDGSATYFLTAANGIMVRHFRGYFDHNLRDYKRVTSVMLVWKFQ
jgi:hypothetical protein